MGLQGFFGLALGGLLLLGESLGVLQAGFNFTLAAEGLVQGFLGAFQGLAVTPGLGLAFALARLQARAALLRLGQLLAGRVQRLGSRLALRLARL